ncbi:hypothetical protein RMQ97_14790 [Maricaulis sp. D1M11]|uniref:hypothetical protein n=1 Tax=Maricaulis sp. D1M11 TaxID=3076117 RepID=UPI0039B5DF64
MSSAHPSSQFETLLALRSLQTQLEHAALAEETRRLEAVETDLGQAELELNDAQEQWKAYVNRSTLAPEQLQAYAQHLIATDARRNQARDKHEFQKDTLAVQRTRVFQAQAHEDVAEHLLEHNRVQVKKKKERLIEDARDERVGLDWGRS